MNAVTLRAAAAAAAAALLLVAAAAAAPARAAEVDDPDVLVLTADNFDDIVRAEETMLVEFYAPWCGHCKNLAPEYARAATELLKEDPPIRLGKVDATEHGALAGRFDVSGYPTLKVMRNGQPDEYKGPRDADGIVAYMRKQAGPAAKPVETAEDVARFQAREDYLVLGLFSKATSRLRSAFSLTATKRRGDFVFLRSSSPALLAKYGVPEDGEAVLALRTFDEPEVRYDGSGTTKDFEGFVEERSMPLVGEYSPATAEAYRKRGEPLLKLFVPRYDAGTQQARYFANRLRPTAEFHRGKLVVAVADAAANSGELQDLGLKVSDKSLPLVMEAGGERHVRHVKLSKQAVADFVEDWANNRIPAHVKSEEPPADNSGPVVTVVGTTFDDIVRDPERDVLIEFYAPWCGHCKALAPTYEKVGKHFRKYDSVVVAKIDATANDYPRAQFHVTGFPTMFLAPAGGGDPIPYDGGRSKEELVEFVRKHASTKFKKKRKKKGKKGKKGKSKEDL